MANHPKSRVKSNADAEKKRREAERKARIAARVKAEGERTGEDLTKRGAPKPVKRGKGPNGNGKSSVVTCKPGSVLTVLKGGTTVCRVKKAGG